MICNGLLPSRGDPPIMNTRAWVAVPLWSGSVTSPNSLPLLTSYSTLVESAISSSVKLHIRSSGFIFDTFSSKNSNTCDRIPGLKATFSASSSAVFELAGRVSSVEEADHIRRRHRWIVIGGPSWQWRHPIWHPVCCSSPETSADQQRKFCTVFASVGV